MRNLFLAIMIGTVSMWAIPSFAQDNEGTNKPAATKKVAKEGKHSAKASKKAAKKTEKAEEAPPAPAPLPEK